MQEMTKDEMLNMIDNLIVCVKGPSEIAVENLLDSQLQWKDIRDLQDYYRDTMFEFLMAHPQDFREDYYWEFCVKD